MYILNTIKHNLLHVYTYLSLYGYKPLEFIVKEKKNAFTKIPTFSIF